MKKTFSVLIAILLIAVCALPCFVSAAGEPTFDISSVSAKAGESVVVKIDIKNNPGISSAKLKVTFDDDFKLEKVTYGEQLGGTTQQPQKLESPVILNWFGGTTELKSDTEYAALTFALGDTASGEYKISVSYDKADVFNLKEENVEFKTTGGVITVTGGTASEAANNAGGDTDTLTIGATGHDDGNGDYVGEEEIFDDEVTEEIATGEKSSKTQVIVWICVAASILIAAAVIVLVLKKKGTPKQD